MSSPSPKGDSRLSRLNINVNRLTQEALRELSDRRGVTTTEVIRQAVGTLKYLDDAATRGARIQFVEPDGRVAELIHNVY